jgi:hypothetical protein
MNFLFEAVISFINELCKSPAKCVSIGNNGDYVILLHALARSNRSMKKIEHDLSDEGYNVINLNYPSTKYSIEYLSEKYLVKAIKKLCTDRKKKIHFVTSSLGGIILRHYLQTNHKLNIDKIVMIAPPNKGSEVVDFMKKNVLFRGFFRWFFGPAGQQLGNKKNSFVNTALENTIHHEIGVIAGDSCINPFIPFLIKGPNDGRVSVKSTKLKNMKDHVVIHSPHCFITSNNECIKQVSYFLSYGIFYHGD